MSQLEKENLEAHVDLCAARYEVLQEKLGSMMSRIERMEENINTLMKNINQNSINIERHAATNTKVIIGSAGTVIARLLSTIVVILMNIS